MSRGSVAEGPVALLTPFPGKGYRSVTAALLECRRPSDGRTMTDL